jgi:hypothetical protein
MGETQFLSEKEERKEGKHLRTASLDLDLRCIEPRSQVQLPILADERDGGKNSNCLWSLCDA